MKWILLVAAVLMTLGGGLWWYGAPDAPFGPIFAGLGVALAIVVLKPGQRA
ncbi:hypothetical protein [Nocardioides sp.]|uniref:hypothetical protein n=1 Tax=Nocardioides sp. TaxID=35761 RepID=UPI0026340F85|nr:hypothetical protein [Nocardioides sp.]